MTKTKRSKLKMNLQHFAKDEPDPIDEPSGTEPAGAPSGTDEPTVSLAEMQRRLAKVQETHDDEIKNLQQSMNDQIQIAVEKAQNEAQLTGKELQAYKAQEAERKFEELTQENAQLKLENTKRALTDEAIKTLSEKSLPVNESVLKFVVKDTAKETLQAIDDMATLLNQQKEAFAQTVPPVTSGGFAQSASNQSVPNILDEAKITGF